MFRPPTKYSEYLQDVRKSIDYILKRVNATTVTQIVAGTNVTISPASGTGVVTINASGGGGGGLPAGGTTGQILAKINNVDYNAEWIDNYALWTSTVKHEVKAGEAINKGQAVYVSSADGTNMIVSKASNALEATSSKTLGILAQSLAHNAKGFVITEGLLAGLDTSAAGAAGDPVWLGTDGNLLFGLANKPYAPANMVSIGVVTRKNSSNGEIFIRIQNGFELDELHNVDARNPNNNDGIFYNSTTQLWEHKPVSAVYATPTLAQVTTAGNTTTNAITVGGLTVGQAGGNGVINFPNTVSGFSAVLRTQYASNWIGMLAGGSSVLVYGSGSINLTGSTTITGITGSAALLVQQGNAAWSPVADFNGSAGTALRVNTNGNILIGTTTDAGYKLDVNGTARVQGAVVFSNSSITNISEIKSSTSTTLIWQGNNTSAGYQQNNLNIQPYTGSLGVHISNQDGTTILYAKSSTTDSAVGVGTTNPLAKFHVTGYKTASSALAQGVYFNNTLVAAANNDVLVGLDINPTFTNGAFTGVQNYAVRLINSAGVNVLFRTGVNNSGTHKISFSNLGATTNSFISAASSGTFSNVNLVLGQAFFDGSTVNTTNNIVIQSNSSTVFEPRTAISYAYLTGDAYVVTAVNNTNAVLGFSNGSNATSTRGAAIFAIAGGSFASTARLDFAISNVNAPVVTTADVAMSLFNSKNFAIGTTTDAGYKLDVVGADSRFNGVRVGIGAGGVSTNTVVGNGALALNTTGDNLIAIGSALVKNTTGVQNIGIGNLSLRENTTGSYNTAIGYWAGFGISTGSQNTLLGRYAGNGITTGSSNVAIGMNSLYNSATAPNNNVSIGTTAMQNGSGDNNIAIGTGVLYNNTASNNTAVGYQAGLSNTTGTLNTLIGHSAGYNNTTAVGTTAVGHRSLYTNSTGSENTGVGEYALQANSTGNQNVSVGAQSMFLNNTGSDNTAVGFRALQLVTSSNNTAVGSDSLQNTTTGGNNVSVGRQSLLSNSTGNYNIALGFQAGYAGVANTTGSNNIFIGYQATGVSATESNRTWIGNSSTTSTWVGGNLLVGTTTNAGYKLDVNGTARFTTGTAGTGIYLTSTVSGNSGTLTISPNATAIGTQADFTISSGNGTRLFLGGNYQTLITSTVGLSVSNGVGIGGNLTVSGGGSSQIYSTDFVLGGIANTSASIYFTSSGYTESKILWRVENLGSYGISNLHLCINGDSATTRATISDAKVSFLTNGNVGLGTTNPTDKFHIVDNTNGNKFARISAGGTDASAAWVAQNDQVDNIVYRVFGSAVTGSQMGQALARSASLIVNLGGTGKFLIGSYSGTDLIFGTSDQARMRLVDSTGNFLIGTMTDNGNKLTVSGNIDAQGYKVNNVLGYTGIFNVPTNPPGQQNIDIQGGIVINIF